MKLTSCIYFDVFWVKIKNKNKKHIVGIVKKPNDKIIERDKIDIPNTQIHFPGLVQALQYKVTGLN